MFVSSEMEALTLLHFNLVLKCCNLWLLFIVSISCFSSCCGACEAPFNCGGVWFEYPFGKRNSGCGDPLLQLQCDNNMPLLDINGAQYYVLKNIPSSIQEGFLIIIDKNLKDCDLSSSKSTMQLWSSDQFHIVDGYKNITLWEGCQDAPQYALVSGCNGRFYYNTSSDMSWTEKCKSQIQLPVRQSVDPGPNLLLDIKEGLEIKWMPGSSCERCMSEKGTCAYNANRTSNPFFCEPWGKSSSSKVVLLACSIGGAVVVAVCVFVFLVYYVKRRKAQPIRGIRGSRTSNVERFLEEYIHEMPTRYSYYELQSITNNFAAKLGEGGFGVVYKGKLPNGTFVAVKILDSSRHSESQFMSEVATIGRIHHVNLVRLMGYCFNGSREVALVYEFMANGSLEKFIFPENGKKHILSWEQSYSIAVGAARGIAYLHQDCKSRIIHFDIKPHNILLDEDFTPKIADFGLAKICGRGEEHISLTATRGTPGYVAPEVWSRNLGPVTDKSDVYSFGMLLLEIVGARRNIDVRVSRSSQLYFPEWVFKLMQNGQLETMLKTRGRGCEEQAKRLTKVGLWCIQYDSRDRPSMSKVVQMLEGNGEDVSDPPMPFNSSTTPTVFVNSSSSTHSL